jgi:MFS family permease
MMMGLMFGSLIGGQLSDRIGRKKTMMISIFIIVPSVMFGGYSPNYACYAILRLITCTALPCIWVSNHSMTMEAFGNHHRKTVIIVKDFLWPVSQIVLVLIVYYNRNWTPMDWSRLLWRLPLLLYTARITEMVGQQQQKRRGINFTTLDLSTIINNSISG